MQTVRNHDLYPLKFGAETVQVDIGAEAPLGAERDGRKRVNGSEIHIDLIGEKVWVQHDGTKDGVVDALLEAGIPQDKIVLGFHHPQMRPYSEFALA